MLQIRGRGNILQWERGNFTSTRMIIQFYAIENCMLDINQRKPRGRERKRDRERLTLRRERVIEIERKGGFDNGTRGI